jgi:hypothetical protein
VPATLVEEHPSTHAHMNANVPSTATFSATASHGTAGVAATKPVAVGRRRHHSCAARSVPPAGIPRRTRR